MASAQLEPLASILRVFADDNATYGDRFEWSCTIRWLNRHEVEICAYMVKITPSIHRAIIETLRGAGVRRILAINYPDGSAGERKTRWIEIEHRRQAK